MRLPEANDLAPLSPHLFNQDVKLLFECTLIFSEKNALAITASEKKRKKIDLTFLLPNSELIKTGYKNIIRLLLFLNINKT